MERALVLPPRSSLAPLAPEQIRSIVRDSVLYGFYEKTVDRESAYEKLKERAETLQKEEAAASRVKAKSPQKDLFGAAAKSAAHAIGSQIGRQIIRGILGSFFGGRR